MGNDTLVLLLMLLGIAALFVGAGLIYARKRVSDLEDFITARGSVGTVSAAATLVASGLGAWILFSPAEAGTWGGLPAVLGYALGAGAPFVTFIPLGQRIRRLMPSGHTLTEFVWYRYGYGMYIFTLLVMLFYMFVFLAAEVTGMALMVSLVADVPLWVTAAVVLASTLAYTAYGGLRASIYTDALQSALMLPILAAAVVAGALALGGAVPVVGAVQARAPYLLDWGYWGGVEGGITFLISVLVANLFHQGYWQRIYAVRDETVLRRGFCLAALVQVPIVFVLGLFGIVAVGLDRAGVPSVALFNVLLEFLPSWLSRGLLIAGLCLVMSSADTLINGIVSLFTLELRRAVPQVRAGVLLRVSRWGTVLLAFPLLWVAAQGYSVLYLFLLADLICAAAVFPVFFGLYNDRYTGTAALVSVVSGLVAGGLLFPDPEFSRGHLLQAFVLAVVVPVVVSMTWLAASRRQERFDLGRLHQVVTPIRD